MIACSFCFFLVTLLLRPFAAYISAPPWALDESQNRTIQAVDDLLWKSFLTELRSQTNVLLFAIQSAIDMNFITQVLDDDMKAKITKSIPLPNLETIEGYVAKGFLRAKTFFYGELIDMINRKLLGLAIGKFFDCNGRFKLIAGRSGAREKYSTLYSEVEDSGLGVTCGLKLCVYDNIIWGSAPISMLTMVSWNIGTIQGLSWTEVAKFAISETESILVSTVRGVGNFDYAEFKYPILNGCTGRVLRFAYMWNNYFLSYMSLTFVIPSEDQMCSSSEDLWKNVQNVDLTRLEFKGQAMLVSIPFFNVSTLIDLRMKLNGTVFSAAFDQPSSRLYNAKSLQVAEVIFNPQIPKNAPIPSIAGSTPRFLAERPFFIALYHEISKAPIIAGFINNPDCTMECEQPWFPD